MVLEVVYGVARFRGIWLCIRRSSAALERPKGEDAATMVAGALGSLWVDFPTQGELRIITRQYVM